mgnify:CR=1 FL=1
MRYYDPTYGRFMSVDLLWAKYAPLQPYHYAGNEPVGRLDWSGRDYDVVIEGETITISAKYFVKEKDKAQLDKALDKIMKDLNGKDKVKFEGKEYTVVVQLEPIVVDDPVMALQDSRSEKFDEDGNLVSAEVATNTNAYSVVTETNSGAPGETYLNEIRVRRGENSVSVHEVLHTLGLMHDKDRGALTKSMHDDLHSDQSLPEWRGLMINGADIGKYPTEPLGRRTVKRK